MRPPARRLPLRGADLVLTAMPKLWNGAGVSNNTVLVVQCDGAVAPERVRRAVERLLDVCPWPAARLRRPFPWGALHWAAGPRASLVPPPVRRQDLAPGGLREAVQAELNTGIDPRREPPLRILLVDGPSPAEHFVVITWFHPLMDPRGSQNLLGHLARVDASNGHPPWNGSTPDFVPLAAADPRSLRERGRIAQRSLRYMQTLTSVPPVSPGTHLASPGRVRFLREAVVEPEPVADSRRPSREISWRLAVVGRAMAGLWAARGLPDVPFLVPISVDLRPKGEPGPTFGNMLAFHFARFRPSDTADVAALAQTLRQQMADALRDGQIEANAVAMEFLRYRPLSTMLNVLPGTAGRETFSFNCADLGVFPAALDALFGRRVLDAYHVPAVLPRPGLGVFFNRCGSRHNLVASWVEGAVTEDEAARVLADVRAAMGWAASR